MKKTIRLIAGAAFALISVYGMCAQAPPARPAFDAFEVASIKPTGPDAKGRYITMQGGHQFVAKNHALKTLIAAAYSISTAAISGGPDWVDSDRFDILAKTPGDVQPNLDEQMAMLRKLLVDRFKLSFHREPKEMPIYALTLAKDGPKLKEGKEPPEGFKPLVFMVSPQTVSLPGRDVSMAEFAAVLQRSAFDRPVVDKTGLAGRYDFDLEFTPDETVYGGGLGNGTPESTHPGFFVAIQQQLGLRLEATKGPIEALVIDHVEKPSEN